MAKCKNCRNLYMAITSDNEYICNWCEKIKDNPHEEIERECEYFEALTNADRIRSMTDEELAEFLSCDCEYVINCKTCKEPVNEYGSCSGLCRYEYLRWLKSKAGCE